MPRTIPELNIDTSTLQKALAVMEPGAVVSYDALTELIGRDVRDGARGCLSSAMRRLVAEGKVFACVRGEGVKRLRDTEIVGEGQAVVAKMRRAARRANRKLAAVDFDALPAASKVQHNLGMSVLAVMEHMAKHSTLKALEARIDQAQVALPVGRTLEAMSKA
jgi:hypothetical protein